MSQPRETVNGGDGAGGTRGELDDLRRRIDRLDTELVRLLNERAACALSIGRLKRAEGMDVYQPDRERDVLRHVREINRGPLADEAVVRLFERIIDEARRLERHAPDGDTRAGGRER